jgi:hypothetical protein
MANNFKIVIAALDKTEAVFGKIQQNFKKVGKAVDKLKKRFPILSSIAGKSLRGIGGALKTVAKAAGIASIATAGIFTFLVKQSLDATDSLGKTARKIGVTTQALASMRYAAKLTGVETATMDMALQRFTRRAAEAAKGTGEAKGALKELRLDATKLVKMPLDKQMQELAGAFAEVETDADKVRLAMKLFDSEGVALVNTLGLGKQALIEMAAEANTLGIALSEDAVQGVEDANDAFTRLGQLFKGVKDQTVAALAPALETLATILKDKVLTSIQETDGGVQAFAQNLAVSIMNGVSTALNALQTLVNGVIGTLNTMKQTADRFTGFFKSDEEKSIGQLRAALAALNQEQEKNNDLASRGGVSIKFAERQNELIEEQKTKLLDLALAKQAAGAIALIPEVNFMDTVNEAFDQMVAGIGKVNEAKKDDAEGGGDDPEEDNRNKLQKNFEHLKALGKQEVDWTAKTTDEKVKHVASGLQSQMSAVAKNSKTVFKIQKAAGIANALVSTYQGAAKAMGAYPFPINVAMAAASVAAGMAQVSAIRSQSFEGGGFTGNGSRSGGVDGKGGFPAILHPNETVIDHTKQRATTAAKQQVIVNQTINVTTGVQSTVRAEINNLMPTIAEVTKSAVLQETALGGSYQAQLQGN